VNEEPSYYLAIIRPENLQRLQEAGLEFYAVRRLRKMNAGDRIVLYKTRGGDRRNPGVVGVFEVLASPQEADRVASGNLFWARYPVRIPWRAIVLSLTDPMSIAPLVPTLGIFPNKARYGSALQTSMKRLPRADYEVIERSMKAHASGKLTS
jgi:predicted RNA-binding protein